MCYETKQNWKLYYRNLFSVENQWKINMNLIKITYREKTQNPYESGIGKEKQRNSMDTERPREQQNDWEAQRYGWNDIYNTALSLQLPSQVSFPLSVSSCFYLEPFSFSVANNFCTSFVHMQSQQLCLWLTVHTKFL